MGIKILRLRYRVAAPPEGCRWCGGPERGHDQSWVPSRKWHGWEVPTDLQIVARARALRGMNKAFVMPDSSPRVANQERTRV